MAELVARFGLTPRDGAARPQVRSKTSAEAWYSSLMLPTLGLPEFDQESVDKLAKQIGLAKLLVDGELVYKLRPPPTQLCTTPHCTIRH